jgi:PHD/YefM family antitoxin component YafN of YafNO toxin-antitoxin module
MENAIALKGVQYVIDSSGKRTAVLISLEEWREIWEDFYDVLVSESRKDEPTVSWETLKAEVIARI